MSKNLFNSLIKEGTSKMLQPIQKEFKKHIFIYRQWGTLKWNVQIHSKLVKGKQWIAFSLVKILFTFLQTKGVYVSKQFRLQTHLKTVKSIGHQAIY